MTCRNCGCEKMNHTRKGCNSTWKQGTEFCDCTKYVPLELSHSPKDEENKAVSQCCGYPMFWSDGIILTCHKCQKETQPKDDGLERVLQEFKEKISDSTLPLYQKFSNGELRDATKLVRSFIIKVYNEAKEEGYADRAHQETATKFYPLGRILTYEQAKEEERERIVNKIKRLKLWSKGTVEGTRADILHCLDPS